MVSECSYTLPEKENYVLLENIPTELKEREQWVMCKLEQKPGSDKMSKIPYAVDNKRAKTTDPDTWTNIDLCFKAFKTGGYDGLGFVFSNDDEYIGIDWDNVRDPETGEIDPEVLQEIRSLGSYAEISQSGTGVHVICKGTKPGLSCRSGCREMYSKDRFFMMTGNHLAGTPSTVNAAPREAIKAIYDKIDPPREILNNRRELSSKESSAKISDEHIISLCRNALNANKFESLWNGDITAYSGDESRADQALINILSFYTQDSPQLDRIFRQSGLYRDKWDREDYRNRTIETALNDLTAVYNPEQRPEHIELKGIKSLNTSTSEGIEELSISEIVGMAEKTRDLRLNMCLPDDHYVTLHKAYLESVTDGYPEYMILTGLSNLSAITQGKVSLRLKHDVVRPNLFINILGTSTVSRKSTIVNKARKIYEVATDQDVSNHEYSIEGLIETLAKEPVSYQVRDEAGGQMAKDLKKYNEGIGDLWCAMYDGQTYKKTLASGRQKEPQIYSIREPFVTRLWATTPENFLRYTTIDDFLSGHMYRILFTNPSYKKKHMPFGIESEEDMDHWAVLVYRTRSLFNHFKKSNGVAFSITDEALGYYNNVVYDLEIQAEQANNEMFAATVGRSQTHILKIAMLLEIGKFELSHTVTLESIKAASEMIIGYFIPTIMNLMNRVAEDAKNNKIEKVITVLRRLGGYAPHTKLLHDSKMVAKEFNECIGTLIEAGAIKERKEKNSKVKYYVLTPQDPISLQNHQVSNIEKSERSTESLNKLRMYVPVREDIQKEKDKNCLDLQTLSYNPTEGDLETPENFGISENSNDACIDCGSTDLFGESDDGKTHRCRECYNNYYIQGNTNKKPEDVSFDAVEVV